MTLNTQTEAVRNFVESMPCTRHLGIEVIALSHGRAELRLTNRPELTFDGTIVQGGIVGVLADYAAVAACGTTLPDGWLMATTGSETHNLAPAGGSQLVAVGEVLKPGKRLAVARADVHLESLSGPLCLTGLFTATGLNPQSS